MEPAGRTKGAALRQAGVLDAMGAALPALLLLFLAFRSGGFFPGASGLAAAGVAVLAAAVVLLVPRARVTPGLTVCAAALAGLAAWTLASGSWSNAPARALIEHDRAVLYLLTLLGSGLLPFSVRRVRWTVWTLAGALVVVAGAALVARTLPTVVHDPGLGVDDRLGYPVSYWNALGLMSGVGIILCGHLTSSDREPGPARVLGAAAVPLLATVLLYTSSRASVWGSLAAVALYVGVGRPRLLPSAALATAPAAAAALAAANPPGALTGPHPTGPEAVATGHRILLIVALSMLGAAVARWLLLRLDRRLSAVAWPSPSRGIMAAGVAGIAALALTGGAALGASAKVESAVHELTASDASLVDAGSGRLFSTRANGRHAQWQVALDMFGEEPLRGTGAGTYAIEWNRLRDTGGVVHDAHSLYLESLGELGLTGLALIVIALVCIVLGLARRARGPDRALFAALLAASLLWVWQAGVDWIWELPAACLWLFAVAGAALAGSARAGAPRRVVARVGRVAAAVAVLALAVLPVRMALSEARFEDATAQLSAGNCAGARSEARAALRAVDSRAAPRQVLGLCALQEKRLGEASAWLGAAVRRDPGNWEPRYQLALVRAAAGRDPTAELRRARSLDPQEPLVVAALRERGQGPRAWRRWSDRVSITWPRSGDP
jgi:O-antigen ligase/polysaccharide polymerase Wzy-like membrane protein